tara:strand:- start:10 stop:249 length:240 start_codon:yes stop_codon:yes gene_type:complete
MSVHIRYRFLKEKGDYLKDEGMTRGYTLVEALEEHPFHVVLKEFYKDFKGRAVQIYNIWRTPAGEANYRMEEEERRMSE